MELRLRDLRDSVDGDVDVPGLSVIRDRSRSLQLPSSSWVTAALVRPGVPHLLAAVTAGAPIPATEGPSPASESMQRPSLPRLSCLCRRRAGSAVCWGLVMAEDGADRSQPWGHTVVMGTRPWSMAAGMACPPTPTVCAGM